MKRLYLLIALTLCLLLTACGKNSSAESFAQFSEQLSQKTDISFSARLRCEYDDRTLSFVLDCVSDAGGCTVTVAEPSIIRGISAHVESGKSSLHFSDLILDTGDADSFGLSPMSALPLFLDALRNGCPTASWEENGEIVSDLSASDVLTVRLYLDKYSLSPTHAEMISNGKVRVFIEISDWNT